MSQLTFLCHAIWCWTLVLCLAMATDAATVTVRADSHDTPLNLDPSDVSYACITKNGTPGQCMNFSSCTNEYAALMDVNEDFVRISTCPGQYDWCCSDPNNVSTASKGSFNSDECLLVKENECPWCVALYRIKGGHPQTQSENRFFCAGALVGTRAVLTAASCVLDDKDNLMVHVRDQQLTIKEVYKHVNYSSAMSRYNVALLLLKEDIVNSTGSACLYNSTIPQSWISECSAYGYGPDSRSNYYEAALRRTNLSSVTEDMCNIRNARGKASSVICPHIDDISSCSYSIGSPIVCGGKVVGVMSNARCRQSTHLATSLWDPTVHSWLTNLLEAQGVPKTHFYSSH